MSSVLTNVHKCLLVHSGCVSLFKRGGMLVWLSLIWAECQWYTRCPNWLQTALFSFRGHLMMCLPTRPTQKEQGFNKLVFCLRSSRSLWGSSSPLSPWDHLQLVNLPIRDTYTLKCCLFSFSPWFQTSRNQIACVWNAFTGKGENGTRGHILLWENKQTLPTTKKNKNGCILENDVDVPEPCRFWFHGQ